MERERAERGYTVHELAALSGCTVRTLHHYDELGLVRAGRAANGYRRYGPAEVDRLQQVLLYREAEMPLADIKRLLDDPAFDARDALAGHLRELHARKERLDGLIASVEKTLASMEGDGPMKDEEKASWTRTRRSTARRCASAGATMPPMRATRSSWA